MSLKEEIQSAIASHSMWKARLEKAIETGTFDTPANVIELDNNCYFGKWLYGTAITPSVLDSEDYRRVKEYHAKFHKIAAKVVELSLLGNKAAATKLMSVDGEYTKITTELVMQLRAWASKVP